MFIFWFGESLLKLIQKVVSLSLAKARLARNPTTKHCHTLRIVTVTIITILVIAIGIVTDIISDALGTRRKLPARHNINRLRSFN